MLLSYLQLGGSHGDMLLPNGGKATVKSYGLPPEQTNPGRLTDAIPANHLVFFQELRRYYINGRNLCVHAGVHPQRSLAEQSDEELLWIRHPFLYSSHVLPYTVLFGHTPQHSVLFDLPYKVGLDTGLVYGNMLTCLDTDAKVLYQVGRGMKRVAKVAVERKWSSAPSVCG